MKDEIMVSICCITYNQEKYIRQALDSFLMQKTNFKYEIIIHDDASTDNTANIIREYEKKYPDIIKPIYQKENQYSKGNSPNLITFKNAKGKYIALCEGDDYWIDKNKLQIQTDYMEENEKCTFCFHNAMIFDDKTQKYIREFVPYVKEEKKYLTTNNIYDVGQLALLNEIPTASYFFKNNIDFPSWYRNIIAGDIIIQLLTTSKGYAYYIDRTMSAYRIGTGISVMDAWKNDDENKNTKNILSRMDGYIYIYEMINKETNYKFSDVFNKIIKNFKYNVIKLKENNELTEEDKKFIRKLNLYDKTKLYIQKKFPGIYTNLKDIKGKIKWKKQK